MTLKNPETNLDTLKIETPEELILKLKDKSKETLANKVEQVVNTINWTTQEKWDALKRELSIHEETEIRKAIDTESDTNIWNILDEWLSEDKKNKLLQSQELADSLKWTPIEWNEKNIVEWLSYIEKFEKAFWEAWKLFSEWKYVAAFMAFISWIFWTWKSKKEKNDTKKEKKEEKEIFTTNDKYIAWLKLFLTFSKKDKEESFSVLQNINIRTKNFNQLEKIVNNENISDDLKIAYQDKEKSDKDVRTAINCIIKDESFIDNTIWKKIKNWKELPLEQLITSLETELKQYSVFEWKSIDDFRWNLNFWVLSFWKKWTWWDLKSKYIELKENKTSKLHWVNEEIIKTLITDSKWLIIDENYDEKYKKIPYTEVDKAFIEDFDLYWKNFQKNLENTKDNIWYFWENNPEIKKDFWHFFKNNPLSRQDTLELYIITWWEKDITKISEATKWLIYLKIWKKLAKNESLRWHTYDKVLYSLAWEWKNLIWKVPETFTATAKNLILNTVDKIIDSTWWVFKEVWSLLDTKHKVIIWWAIIAWWVVLSRLSFARWLMKWLAIWWIWIWISNIISWAKKDNPNEFKKLLEKNNLTENDLIKLLKKEAEKQSS